MLSLNLSPKNGNQFNNLLIENVWSSEKIEILQKSNSFCLYQLIVFHQFFDSDRLLRQFPGLHLLRKKRKQTEIFLLCWISFEIKFFQKNVVEWKKFWRSQNFRLWLLTESTFQEKQNLDSFYSEKTSNVAFWCILKSTIPIQKLLTKTSFES